MKIAILGRDPQPGYARKAADFITALHKSGAEICYAAPLRELLDAEGLGFPDGGTFSSASDLPGDADLFLALGGDGTFLSSMSYVRESPIPVAGVNFGRLGFLTAAEAGEKVARDLAGGAFSVQDRAVLHLEASGFPQDIWPYALNEISFQRSGSGMLSIDVSIDGEPLPTYWADGILIATSTGSTAYSMSLGGPLVSPDCDVILITPIASHNLNVRPLVIPLSSDVTVRARSSKGGLSVAVDNRSAEFDGEVCARIRRGAFPLRSVVLSEHSFLTALGAKLHWGEDIRNSSNSI